MCQEPCIGEGSFWTHFHVLVNLWIIEICLKPKGTKFNESISSNNQRTIRMEWRPTYIFKTKVNIYSHMSTPPPFLNTEVLAKQNVWRSHLELCQMSSKFLSFYCQNTRHMESFPLLRCQGKCDQVTGVSWPKLENEHATNHIGVNDCFIDSPLDLVWNRFFLGRGAIRLPTTSHAFSIIFVIIYVASQKKGNYDKRLDFGATS